MGNSIYERKKYIGIFILIELKVVHEGELTKAIAKFFLSQANVVSRLGTFRGWNFKRTFA